MSMAGRPWIPGTPGKGFELETGEIVLWTTDDRGEPWHSQKCEQLTGDRYAYRNPITILPNGRCAPSNQLREMPADSDGGEAQVAASHGYLRLVSAEEYKAAGAKLYAHADRLARLAAAKPAEIVDMPADAAAQFKLLPSDTKERCEIVLGTRTWRALPELETDIPGKLCKLIPQAAGPRAFRKRQSASRDIRGTVWGFDTIVLRFDVPGGTADARRVERLLGPWLCQRLANPELIWFPHGSAPADVFDAAWDAYEDKLAAAEAAERALAATDEEREQVHAAMVAALQPGSYRTFTCEADLAAATGLTADRVRRTLTDLAADKVCYSSGIGSRQQGSFWTLDQRGPVPA